MSTSRAAALASAAMTSSRLAQTYPKASPVPTVLLSHSPRHNDRKGKAREVQPATSMFNEGEDDYEDDGLSARQRRLSRAARFATTSHSTFTNLPKKWVEMADHVFHSTHKQMVRSDYRAKVKDQLTNRLRLPKNKNRALPLHLTTESPFRYAALVSVLRQVRNRLGPDQEGLAKENSRTWSPTRIIEYGCRAGEGLWAAKEVFGSSSIENGDDGIRTYLGMDSNSNLLRCAIDFIKKTMPEPETPEEETLPSEEIDAPLSLYGTSASFKNHPHSPDAIAGSKSEALEKPTVHDGGTMVICSYILLLQFADAHRTKLIRTIWNEYPDAEVIVFVEEAHERGFAALASVREYILGIGAKEFPAQTLGFHLKSPGYYDRGLLDEEDTVEAAKGVSGEWHVVAPCPHDKPCPLLHDYDFSGPPNTPTTRTSSASSPLFHGSNLGMTICSFNSRLLKPEHTRFAMGQPMPEGAAHYSYLVLRRGPRPSIALEARAASADEASFMTQREELRKRSQLTKIGDIEEIRAGSKKESVTLAEELDEDDAEGTTLDNLDEDQARDELLKLLPAALGGELEGSDHGDETVEMDEAIRLAHEMMKKSADVADEAALDESGSSIEQDQMLLTSEFLNQTLQLNARGEKDIKKPLESDDVEAMSIESYEWPRIIRPAIKKSGHVTFDVCSSHGSIDRFTVSKSSGKQIYQDARKSNYGDLFPHVAFSDEEGVQANIKSLITRVPSAGKDRSGLPPTFHKDLNKPIYQRKKAERLSSTMPSYVAIGADRVSPKTSRDLLKDLAKTRREHTKGDKSGRRREEMTGDDYERRPRLTPRQELLAAEDGL